MAGANIQTPEAARATALIAAAVLCACVTAGALTAPATARRPHPPRPHRDAKETGAPLDLASAELHQDVWDLRLELTATQGWAASDLARNGTGAPGSYLCLKLRQRRHEHTLCVVPHGGQDGLTLARPVHGGRFRVLRSATVRRESPRSLSASFDFRRARLRPAELRWRLTSRWAGAPCEPVADGGPGACLDSLPDAGAVGLRLIAPLPVGCRVKGPNLRYNGSRKRNRVGLSFDDGPSPYTPQVLRILRRFNAHATFFQVGSEIGAGGGDLEQKILRQGNELGDHTEHHTSASPSEIAGGQRTIRRASGFTTCLFRPPGGGASAGVTADAAADGMKTIIWDVDPRDWATPGVGAIQSTVLGTVRRGSIILMHDGPTDRAQTVAALPGILRGLGRRHLEAATVTRLLHGRFIYR